MILMSCTDLARGYDATPLFDGVSFELYAGERVGLVGPNGAGKTTLLKVLSGLDQPDRGDVRLHAGATLAILRQHPDFGPTQTLFQEAKDAFAHLLEKQEDLHRTAEQLAAATDEAERKSLAARFDRLTEQLHHEDAFALDHRVEEVLDGLGFRREDYDRPVNTFSGGQQRRLLLAKILLTAADVMLLDEPSNHLDIGATRWLESYLIARPQGMIIVSHDRYFLDRVTNKTFELHQRQIRVFPGNYRQYVRLRRERYEQDLKAWEAQREYVLKQEEYIRRVNYGQLAKQAQSRQKTLDKLERVEKPTLISAPAIKFGDVTRAGDVVFEADGLSKAFDRPLFRDLSFQVKRGQRLGIMGPNGCGKTTLLRILIGEEKPDTGVARRGHLTQLGYLDQHLKLLPDDKSVIDAVWPKPDPSITNQTMRDLLARFGLQGEIVEQKVGELSGGERSRAALARLVAAGVNVLVLDEPTNHLDLWACEALEDALLNFEGTVIVVSHDRYFLNRVVDLLIVFEGERPQVVYGNFDTYESLRAEQLAAAKEKEERQSAAARKSGPPPAASATAKKKWKYPYRKVNEIEADIAVMEETQTAAKAALESPEIYRDHEKVKETMAALESAGTRLTELYEHWEEMMERDKRA
ncbi:MAG: ABC-F family ATP-binding cassette domain-containing protein [Gemmataceae bacterium]|nr:ABC-F family ATP-binding cassette domain-containing protein [Gemmataceae bacterium]